MDRVRNKLFGQRDRDGTKDTRTGYDYTPVNGVVGSREALLSRDEIEEEEEDEQEDSNGRGQEVERQRRDEQGEDKFSWIEYAVFLLMGVAMLWAWNMFLAAAPYFHRRFQSSQSLSDNFQASEISVSTLTNLCSVIVLTKLQRRASYPRRIITSLCVTTVCFTLLAISTVVNVSAGVYFGFLMVMVACSSLATGLIQNGLFAYAGGFGSSAGRYTQGVMTGQAVAGVLPCVAQIMSVQAVGQHPPHEKGHEEGHGPHGGDGRPPPSPLPPSLMYKSARVYFILATCVSVAALLAFLYLLQRQQRRKHRLSSSNPPPKPQDATEDGDEALLQSTNRPHKSVPLSTLFLKLPTLSVGVFLCFAITMSFPVFTAIIPSVHYSPPSPPSAVHTRTTSDPSSFLAPPTFIPLSFLLWNLGDLFGRLLTLLPTLHIYHHPSILLLLALSRAIFVPLYFLCNIRGRGAIINSDAFYLIIVQVGFGLSNGYVGSECMIGAGEWIRKGGEGWWRSGNDVEDGDSSEEAKSEIMNAAGAWMGLCLVAGLTVGSLASFGVVGAV